MKQTRVRKDALLSLLVLFQISAVNVASAEIFKCTNKQGKVYYNDKPCPVESKEKKMQNEKDPANGYVPLDRTINGKQTENSFIKTKQSDETGSENEDQHDNEETHVKRGADNTEKFPVKRFNDENLKMNHKRSGSKHPKRKIPEIKKGNKMTLEEKKSMLGIYEIPQ